MIKYLIILAVVVICVYIGYGLSAFYTNRSKFFKNLELLFEKMRAEINYSQKHLLLILKNYSSQNKVVQKLIYNFIQCLEFNLAINNDSLFSEIKILNDEEKNIICLFFKSLGKFDTINQTTQLNSQTNEIQKFYERAEEEAKKYASLYLKLGIIAGLVIALIFV